MAIGRRAVSVFLACARGALAAACACGQDGADAGSQDSAADGGSGDAAAPLDATVQDVGVVDAAMENPRCAADALFAFPHCGGVCCNGACATDEAGASVCVCGALVGGCPLDPNAVNGECCGGACLNALACAP